MTTELGQFALCLAFILSLVQASVPLIGAQTGRDRLMAIGVTAAQGQLLLIAFAFAALTKAHLASDFSVLNVAQNSHSAKPFIYKLSGVWGNHEGSMLLWVLILALFGAIAATVKGGLDEAFRARALAVQGLIGACFLAFILFTSNPFWRLSPAPLEGQGLNPLLQDPGLALHPPFLYLGYVGFSMAFSFAVAALIGGQVDRAWARWVRPWTLGAWMALTVGIALGSWWAYYELGWGGWWFWDPVENASLMPWILGTALLHSARVVETRGALKNWTVLLAILTFSFSLLGTFLVRSGVLTSVHAFANDPARGVFILAILLALTGGALTLYAARSRSLAGGSPFEAVSREGALVLNNLFLVTACVTVMIGTLYPLMLDSVGGGPISVGPPYFNQTVVPLMIPVFLAMPIGAMLPWKKADLGAVLTRLTGAGLLTIGAMAVLTWLLWGGPLLAVLALGVAIWLVLGSLAMILERAGVGTGSLGEAFGRIRGIPARVWGTAIAHAGVGIFVAGVTGVSAFQTETVARVGLGEPVSLSGYTFTLDRVSNVEGPNYKAERGTVSVTRNGRPVTVLYPERRFYPVAQSSTTEVALHTKAMGDLYVVLGEAVASGAADGGRAWTLRLYTKPLISWIWMGSLIMVLGGAFSLRASRAMASRRQDQSGGVEDPRHQDTKPGTQDLETGKPALGEAT